MKRFRKKGLAKEQQLLVEGLSKTSFVGQSILDIGCGIGGLHLTLLLRGASTALGIDIAPGMIDAARTLSREHHMEFQTDYRVGDFVAMRETIAMADLTIADKVVCCYADLPALLSSSLSKTRRVFALTHPRDHTFNYLLIRSLATLGEVLRLPFHPYWHDWQSMSASIEANGLRRVWSSKTLFWQVEVFERVTIAQEM